ncbi:hypothetical protein ACJIZ3_008125 [Penstemon smallii]|uniref:TF-B3 domain-containing protein n=1 Tax=Penstemon smallii TaxID=265156 RepID=A0ABD3T8W8_9LAMI
MFFKIVSNPRARTLRIPPEFTRRYGRNMPNHIFLKAPASGSLWKVELTHCREIDYPFHANHDRHIEPKIEDIELESDDSIVFLEKFSTIPQNNESVQIPEPRSTRQETRRMRAEADDLVEVSKWIQLRKPTRRFRNCFPHGHKEKDSSLKKPTTPNNRSGKNGPKRMNLDQVQSTEEVQRKVDMDTSKQKKKRKRRNDLNVKSEDEHRFTEQENDFDAGKRWRFSKELKKYNLDNYFMTIPKAFAIGTGIARNREIQLLDVKGRKWPVRVINNNRFAMSAGLKDFLRGNNVVDGNTISFEFIPNSSDNIRLPPAFVRRYSEILPGTGNATLRINSGKTWKVKLEELENAEYWFTRGWNIFVKDVGLEFGEFLVFTYNGTSIFDVSVFGVSGCEREFLAGTDSDIEADEIVNKSNDNSNPYLEVSLADYRKSRVCIRKHFAEAAGLISRSSVSLEYEDGSHVDDVQLVCRESRGYSILELASGWPEFRKKNKLVMGKTYSFEFIPNRNVIRVKPINK